MGESGHKSKKNMKKHVSLRGINRPEKVCKYKGRGQNPKISTYKEEGSQVWSKTNMAVKQRCLFLYRCMKQ